MSLHLLRLLGLTLALLTLSSAVAVAAVPVTVENLLQKRLIEHESIIATDAQNVESLLVLAQTHERLGHWRKALDYYRQIRQIDAGHAPARRGTERLEKILRPRLTAQWSYFVDEEYAPQLKTKDYQREETLYQLGAEKQLGKDSLFQLDWRKGAVEQTSEIYQDTDFSVKYYGPTLRLGLPLSSRFSLRGKLEYTRYSRDKAGAFYPLKEEKDLLTGSASLTYVGQRGWLTSSLLRYRDFNLNFDASATQEPGALQLVAQTVYGLDAGTQIDKAWNLSGGVLYEDSQTLDPDQFRLRSRLSYAPSPKRHLQFFGRGDYYFEEKKTLVGGGVSYLLTLFKRMDTALSYQLLYNDPENSWLNQATLDMKWHLAPRIAWKVAAQAGQEIGDDEDQYYLLTSGLTVRF